MLPHELGCFARDLAIGNLDARKHISHYRTPISVCLICVVCVAGLSRNLSDTIIVVWRWL
jgi:hypothetical protein